MNTYINLLPWREARREARTRAFYYVLLLMLIAGLAVGFVIMNVYQHQLVAQQQRNAFITTHIDQLNNAIADVQRYQTDVDRLSEQLSVFKSLYHDRLHTLQLLNDLAVSVVDGVVYQRLSRSGDIISLTGVAESEPQVFEQLRQIANMPGFDMPTLSEMASGEGESPHFFQFEVTQVRLMQTFEEVNE